MQAGRLFSNQVRIAGIDWRDAVSIDRPLHPSISEPAEALTRDGTAGRGERGGDRFKRSPLGDSLLLTESSIRQGKKSSEINLTADSLSLCSGNVQSWYNYEFSLHSDKLVISKYWLQTICDFILKLKSFNQRPSFLGCLSKLLVFLVFAQSGLWHVRRHEPTTAVLFDRAPESAYDGWKDWTRRTWLMCYGFVCNQLHLVSYLVQETNSD